MCVIACIILLAGLLISRVLQEPLVFHAPAHTYLAAWISQNQNSAQLNEAQIESLRVAWSTAMERDTTRKKAIARALLVSQSLVAGSICGFLFLFLRLGRNKG